MLKIDCVGLKCVNVSKCVAFTVFLKCFPNDFLCSF